MKEFFSLAFGIGTKNKENNWLEVFYPYPLLNPSFELVRIINSTIPYNGGNQYSSLDSGQLLEISRKIESLDKLQSVILKKMSSTKKSLLVILLSEDTKPTSVPEIYLKLHLLSYRLAQPNSLNLVDIFTLLPNIAWTNKGAIASDDLNKEQLFSRIEGSVLEVFSVDKFPKMTNYILPSQVRIADTSRVRLGAYLGRGTTVMPEGAVNFNSGTHGPAMIEGRISSGVTVGKESDLGGGCSTMGTLSGGGKEIISIGDNCLIGANAGTGITLGDRNTIESGLYITSGTKVSVLDQNDKTIEVAKAKHLSGQSDLLFRRNSQTGVVECKIKRNITLLNNKLHSHN